MILKIGMKFRRIYESETIEYEIVGQGLNEHYLKLLGDRCYLSEMHIDTFNMLYERGEIEFI